MAKNGTYSDYTLTIFNFEILSFLLYCLKINDCFVTFFL